MCPWTNVYISIVLHCGFRLLLDRMSYNPRKKVRQLRSATQTLSTKPDTASHTELIVPGYQVWRSMVCHGRRLIVYLVYLLNILKCVALILCSIWWNSVHGVHDVVEHTEDRCNIYNFILRESLSTLPRLPLMSKSTCTCNYIFSNIDGQMGSTMQRVPGNY